MGVNTEYRANLVSLFACFPRFPTHQDGVDNRDKVFSVANKSEYIRKGYALRKSLKGLSTRNRKKKTECFAKFIDYHSSDIPVKVLKVQ